MVVYPGSPVCIVHVDTTLIRSKVKVSRQWPLAPFWGLYYWLSYAHDVFFDHEGSVVGCISSVHRRSVRATSRHRCQACWWQMWQYLGGQEDTSQTAGQYTAASYSRINSSMMVLYFDVNSGFQAGCHKRRLNLALVFFCIYFAL